jgi:septal ring factor EnvC (AmiA/AmiB activator)
MEKGFDLLEEKVRKAADLVRHLRKENGGLRERVEAAEAQVREAAKRLQALERQAPTAEVGDGQEKELKALRQQRDEVRRRIARLLEVLEGFDEDVEPA